MLPRSFSPLCFFSLRGEKKSPVGNRLRGRQIDELQVFLPLLLSPSLDCYRPESATDGRFRVVIGRKQAQSTVPPGSGRSLPGIAKLDFEYPHLFLAFCKEN
ncbi:hypothetical protein BHE74_00010667 [Ensete ventricosum]|nr:hypothetical protein GW17_00034903 [Ensete ventricosum]RWW80968.1 hypothetical protein BHE74_00010667 [Ensete ventricosum]